MHSPIDPGTEGSGGDGAAVTGGHRSAEEDRRDGVSEAQSNEEHEAANSLHGGDEESGDSPAPVNDSDQGGGEKGDGDSRPAQSKVSPRRGAPPRVSDREIEIALKGADGNFALAAKALGIDRSGLHKRIKNKPHLYAIWGEHGSGKDIPVPTEATTLMRKPVDLPVVPTDPMLGKMVIQTEKLIRDGLINVGVPQSTIDRLKAFDGLAVGAGAFLAQSLQDTHQIYYVNLLKLDEMAADIKRRYLDEDATEKPDDMMARMFWQRAYNEIVEQLGKGHDRMLAGTQAMVAMMKAREGGKSAAKGPKPQPGF